MQYLQYSTDTPYADETNHWQWLNVYNMIVISTADSFFVPNDCYFKTFYFKDVF